VAAVCCPGCPDVEILSAGHGPLFVYFRSDDRFREIHAHALPLGIVPSFQSDPPDHMRLSAGDLVLLATDGFFEWENEMGEEFGVRRLQDAIRTFRDAPPKEIIARLYETARDFSHGTKPQDDLTALIIKRT
jgi:serine phosphatase RsbU (regulator of sigma subunit)